MNQRSPMQQWQQPSQPRVTPTQSGQHYQKGPTPRQVQQPRQLRGRSRQQQIFHDNATSNTRNESKSHSNSITPRRKGNPQSPHAQNKQQVVDSLEIAKSRSRSNSSARILDGNVDLTTPLSALSTILTTTKNYHSCAIKNYRVNHQLFRDAKDRTAKAEQALAQAKAEFEHATTAQEYAHSELTASLSTKQQCETHTIQVEKQVRKIGQQLKGKRVKLVGLTQNVKWNGRTGVIVKLIIEGEDCGRWKVRLDREIRGGDPEGMDERDSLNGEATRGNGQYREQQHQCEDENEDLQDSNLASHHVVAKAENLELLDEVDHTGLDGSILRTASNTSTRSRSRSNKSRTSSRSGDTSGISGKSRDPSTSRYSENFQAAGLYSNGRARTPIAVTPEQMHNSPASKIRSPSSRPELVSPKRNGKNLPSAFSNMLLSPVSFEHVSFTAVPSDSFMSPNRSAHQTQSTAEGNGGENGRSDNSIAGSFFDEITPHEHSNQSIHPDEYSNQMEYQHHEQLQHQQNQIQCHHSVEGESHRGYPQEIYSTDLPTLVILPVQQDEENDGFASPYCIGVQDAGVPHINGVYLLANDNTSSSEEPSSPLYFKDAPPTQLEDDRYYDMCILRIDCPDDPNYVIWFLSRVDVDPSCLDVKFSDCYYYCRMLRNDSGDCPPLSGWNIPKVPPGIAVAPSTSFSLESDGYHASELGEVTQY